MVMQIALEVGTPEEVGNPQWVIMIYYLVSERFRVVNLIKDLPDTTIDWGITHHTLVIICHHYLP